MASFVALRINNIVVANQITAKARKNVWPLSVPLGFLQSITDGGLFDATRVYRLKSEWKHFRKPGFHSFKTRESLHENKSVERVNLVNATWINPSADNFIGKFSEGELSDIVFTHCQRFWKNYNCTLDFEIELKLEHTAVIVSYYGKANYMIDTIVKTQIMKVRGVMGLNDNLQKK
jgi:hypothetical protein